MRFFKKLGIIGLGLSMALGVGISLGVSNSNVVETKAASVALINWGDASTTTTSGTVADAFSWAAAKNSASSAPAYNAGSKEIRMYYNAAGNGCNMTITPVTGVAITQVILTASSTSYTPTVKYNVDGGADIEGTWSSTTMTIDISSTAAVSSFVFRNANTSNKQLRLKSMQITYDVPSTDDVITALSVTPTAKTYWTTDVINSADYTVSVTKNGAAGSLDDLYIELGTGTGSSFVKTANVVWGETVPVNNSTIQFRAKYPSTAGGSEYLLADVALTVNEPTLDSVVVTGDMSTKTYGIGSNWNPAGLVVTANYGNGASVDVTNDEGLSWSYNPATAATLGTDLSVVCTATFNEVSGNKTVTGISVVSQTTYDFVSNFSTYSSEWGSGYNARTITNTDLGSGVAASISFIRVSKQTSTITDRPVPASNTTSYADSFSFTLSQEGKQISSISIEFSQWGSKTPSLALYANAEATEALAEITIGTSNTLSVASYTGTSFLVKIKGTTTTSNVQVGLSSITVGLADIPGYAAAKDYAELFLTDTCSQNQTDWATWGTMYNELSVEARALLTAATYDPSTYETNSSIQKCAQRYDLVVAKGGFTNFMSRTNTSSSINSNNISVSSSTTVVILVSVIAITSIGAFFFINKKRRLTK